MSVDYDAIAGAYDRRYLYNDYSGVERAVTAFIGSGGDTRVLEVGCGTGHWLQSLRKSGVGIAIGLDASMGMLMRGEVRGSVVHGLAENLPCTTESFDRVFCVNALHHFDDKATFLVEARRVLRQGGRLMTIGLDPHVGTDQWYIYDYFESALDTDRRRYPAAHQIRQWMHAAAFTDCVTREIQHLPVRLPARTALEQGRLAKGASSQLSLLTDEQYQKGIDRIRQGIESAEARGSSFYLTADLRLFGTFGSV